MTTLCATPTVSMSVLLPCALHLYIPTLYILRLLPSQTWVWMLLLRSPLLLPPRSVTAFRLPLTRMVTLSFSLRLRGGPLLFMLTR